MLNQQVQDEIQNITKQLIDKYHPQKIILFGSAAWAPEEFNKDSDLDFFIVKDDVPHFGHDRIYEIEKLFIHREMPCDFIVYKNSEMQEGLSLGDPFVKQIVSMGDVLYG